MSERDIRASRCRALRSDALAAAHDLAAGAPGVRHQSVSTFRIETESLLHPRELVAQASAEETRIVGGHDHFDTFFDEAPHGMVVAVDEPTDAPIGSGAHLHHSAGAPNGGHRHALPGANFVQSSMVVDDGELLVVAA